jgi:DNA polymerase III subunit beta
MKLTINRSELADALTVATSVAPLRTPKQILQCVLVEVFNDYALVSATDLEISVRFSISQVQVEETGAIVVAADKLGQVVRESNDEVLILESDDNYCLIHGRDSHFKIFAQDVKQFPPVPDFDGDCDFEIPVGTLKRLCEWTIFAAARENTRYAINGVLWERKGNTLTFVSTDGRRLSKGSFIVEAEKKDQRGIVPIKAMQLFTRVFTEQDETVAVNIASNRITLKSPKAMVTAALLEGHFPKYEDVIPQDSDKSVQFATQELLSAVRRAALLTSDDSKGVRLSFDDQQLTLTSRAPDQGEAEVSIPVDYSDSKLDIGFNPVFLTDVLRVVAEDNVTFEFKESNRPGLFRTSDGLLYVVMPVNLS